MSHTLLLPPDIQDALPAFLKQELAAMDAMRQSSFVEEYQRKAKSLFTAYICLFLGGHYLYIGRVSQFFLYILVTLVTFGIGGFIWFVIDIFRLPGLVRNINSDIAVSIVRDICIISSHNNNKAES